MSTELNYEGHAFGTSYNISLISSDINEANYFSDLAIKKINHFEQIFSRFLPTSELSQLNQSKKLVVSSDFIDLTVKALELYKKTDGTFNPLLQVSRLGYDTNFDTLEKKQTAKISTLEYDFDFSTVEIDTQTNTIVLSSGQELDFGGILKGYLAENICQEIIKTSAKISGVIINLGGDLATAGLDAENKNFLFTIVNPSTNINIENISMRNRSLVTSGVDKRTWEKDGEVVSHIMSKAGSNTLDNDLIAVSIIHDHGAEAEAFTKVFFNLGIIGAVEHLASEKFNYAAIKKDGTLTHNLPNL